MQGDRRRRDGVTSLWSRENSALSNKTDASEIRSSVLTQALKPTAVIHLKTGKQPSEDELHDPSDAIDRVPKHSTIATETE